MRLERDGGFVCVGKGACECSYDKVGKGGGRGGS